MFSKQGMRSNGLQPGKPHRVTVTFLLAWFKVSRLRDDGALNGKSRTKPNRKSRIRVSHKRRLCCTLFLTSSHFLHQSERQSDAVLFQSGRSRGGGQGRWVIETTSNISGLVSKGMWPAVRVSGSWWWPCVAVLFSKKRPRCCPDRQAGDVMLYIRQCNDRVCASKAM